MTQLAPNFLLALKAGKESRIGLQTQVRRLDGDDLIFLLLVPGLVNGGHPAAAHRLDDGEPSVQQIAGMQLRAEVRFDRVMVFGHVLETTDAFHGVGFVCCHAFVGSAFQGRLHWMTAQPAAIRPRPHQVDHGTFSLKTNRPAKTLVSAKNPT